MEKKVASKKKVVRKLKDSPLKETATTFIDADKFFALHQELIEWVLAHDLEQLDTILVLQHALDFFKHMRYREHFNVMEDCPECNKH
jgi:hypothetical protein